MSGAERFSGFPNKLEFMTLLEGKTERSEEVKEEGRLDEEEGREEVKYGKELEDVDMEDDSDRVVTRA